MQVKTASVIVAMVSVFREPYLRLGVEASEVMEQFYKAIRTPGPIPLKDLITSGGNTYADLKLTVKTFGGGGRIDITPGALIVELRDISQVTGHAQIAKEHLQLCEDTARVAMGDLGIAERSMRANLWLSCEGGRAASEAFLEKMGNAALRLNRSPYDALKKEFTLQFSGLDAAKATKIGFAVERSSDPAADLFMHFDYSRIGSPTVAATVADQFEEAEQELLALMAHVGLEPRKDDAGSIGV